MTYHTTTTTTLVRPAVRVTLAAKADNLPPITWRTYVRTTDVHGNLIVLDAWGYELRVSADRVTDLGYDITAFVIDGKLVTHAVCIVDPSIDGPTLWDCPCAECRAIVRDNDGGEIL